MDNKTARQDLETVIRVEDLALGSMRKLRGIQDWLRSQATDTVPMPENKDHARAMAIIGMKWLQDNSPGELVHVGAIEPVITNEMKAEFMGEFEFTIEAECGECIDAGEDEDCEVCQGGIVYERKVTVPWKTCKEIYKRMSVFASARTERGTTCEVCGYMYGPTSCKCKKHIASLPLSASAPTEEHLIDWAHRTIERIDPNGTGVISSDLAEAAKELFANPPVSVVPDQMNEHFPVSHTCPECECLMTEGDPASSGCGIWYCGECGFNDPEDGSHE